MTIDLTKWVINMPTFPPDEDIDNSSIAEAGRCPRKYLYRYGMRRGFKGMSYSIQFGLAYHKYRETVEKHMIEHGVGMSEEIHQIGLAAALEGFENPPLEHKDSFLDKGRLMVSCAMASERIEREQKNGSIEVIRAEDSFDLEMPFVVCRDCAWSWIPWPIQTEETTCSKCNGQNLFRARHGGRIDNVIKYHAIGGVDAVRDYKTTKYMPKGYEQKFDPNNQFFGYTWAGSELSGRMFDGALVETLYNTKTKGPIFSTHYVTYSAGQIEAWQVSMMLERQFLQTMWNRVPELGYLAFPMRTSECGSFGGCSFRQACRSGGAHELEAWLENYTTYSHWDYANPDEEVSKV